MAPHTHLKEEEPRTLLWEGPHTLLLGVGLHTHLQEVGLHMDFLLQEGVGHHNQAAVLLEQLLASYLEVVGNLPLEGDIHQWEGNPVQEDSHQGQGDTLQEAGNLDQEGGNQLWGDILHLEEEDNHLQADILLLHHHKEGMPL